LATEETFKLNGLVVLSALQVIVLIETSVGSLSVIFRNNHVEQTLFDSHCEYDWMTDTVDAENEFKFIPLAKISNETDGREFWAKHESW
jgi:hypothetical protein